MAERKQPTLRRNFSWVFVGNALYAAAQWGMLTVLAKLGTPQMVGQFALGLAVAAPVIMLANLNLQAVIATDAKRRYVFGDYFALRLLTTALALAAILGIAFFTDYPPGTMAVIMLLGLAKAFEAMSDVLYGLFMQRERMDRIAKSMIVKGALSLTALGLAVYLTGSVAWGVAGMALAWATVLFGYDIRSGARVLAGTASGLRPRWAAGTLASLAWLALPLGFVMALISLNINIPRYFIEHYLGTRELGIFAAMSYILIAGTMVVAALGQSASPRLAKLYADGDREGFLRLLFKAAGVGAVLGAVAILAALVAGKEALTLLYSPEYAEDTGVFLLLMAGAAIAFVASFMGYGMTAARYFGAQLPLFALTAAAIALACWWLVPAGGLMGAAIALIIGDMVQLCGSVIIVAHAVRRIPKGAKA